jgi:hypothetical protein
VYRVRVLQGFHSGINTNNYMESMNRVFKRKWITGRINQRLDSLLRVHFKCIVPHYNRTYLHDNVRSAR